ncbi:hypothetical protein [Minwuia thermotolerans]|nr:hypothetical protein [Minwuia thermotolerans]
MKRLIPMTFAILTLAATGACEGVGSRTPLPTDQPSTNSPT